MSAHFFGLAHYSVAIYFLFSSKHIRNLRGILMLMLFTALALGACYLLYLAGGPNNLLAMIAVFIFFLTHGLRDETFFYRQRSGKAISDQEYPHAYRMLIWVQMLGLGLMGAILYPVYIFKLYGNPKHPPAWTVILVVASLVAGLGVVVRPLLRQFRPELIRQEP